MFIETPFNLMSTARCPLCGAAVPHSNVKFIHNTEFKISTYYIRCHHEHLFIVMLNTLTDINPNALCLKEDWEDMGDVRYKCATAYYEGNYDV